jgi:Tfp pilus assembly protein PilN
MPSLINQLNAIKLDAPRSTLVLHSDGVRLCAAVVRAAPGGGRIAAAACSLEPEPRLALGAVLADLRAQGVRRPPKRPILISASALPALLELPVDPRQPRPAAQMHELVRWEMESLFSEQAGRWCLGALLMARGEIDASQRQRIAAAQARPSEDPAAAPSGRGGPARRPKFGEVAVRMGLVDPETVDTCLALQARLAQGDDDLVCGWRGQTEALTAEDEDGGEAGFPWLAAAIPEGERAAWVRACERYGLFLSAIVPQLGGRFAAQAAPHDDTLYLEWQAEQLLVVRGAPGRIRRLRVVPLLDGTADEATLTRIAQEELAAGVESFVLLGPEAQAEPLAAGLRSGLERAVTVVSAEASHPRLPEGLADAVLAAAATRQPRAPASPLVPIRAQPPRPPIWKRRELWPYAASLLVILSVVGNEARMRIVTELNERELARLDAEYEERMQLKTAATEIESEASQLQQELEAKQATVAELEERVEGLEYLESRQGMMPRLLERLGDVLNDEMLVTRLKVPPEPGGTIYLRGWALTNTAGQLFISNLNNVQDGPRLQVDSSRIAAGPGPYGVSGFSVEVWFTLRDEARS